MFPLGLPAPLRKDVRNVATSDVLHIAFDHTDAVGQHQRQPVPVAGFAILESEATDHAAQASWRRRSPECGREVRSLVGMQNLYARGLLRRALPTVACVLPVIATLHRISRVVLRVGIYAPSLHL